MQFGPLSSVMMLGVLSAAASAQEKPAEVPAVHVEAKRLKGVVPEKSKAATKTELPILEIPQSISSVGREEIEQRGAQSVAEAVRYVPGVLTGVGGEDSRVDDITIRGFDAGGFTNNVYLDGLRVPSGGQFTRSQFDVFGMERVEILKGPSSVLYGQVAPGGLVNQVSKRPPTETGGLVAFRYGSFGTWQVAADSGGPLDAEGKFFYRIAGLYREGGAQIDHTDLSRFFIAPSFTWNISGDTKLTLLANYQDDHGGATYQFLPVDGTLYKLGGRRMDRETFIGEPDFNTFDREQYSIGYELDHRFNETWSLQQNFRFANVETYYEAIVGGTTPPTAAGNLARRAVQSDGDAASVTVDTRLQAEFATGPLEHTLVAGYDLIHTDWNHVRNRGNVAAINIFNPVYTGGPATLLPQIKQEVEETQHGVYVQDQVAWNAWRLTAGGRYDWFESNLLNRINGVRTITDPEQFTGRVGLLYLFENGIAPYGSFSTSFEPLSGTDADQEPFDPTEGRQFEIGVKYEPKNFNALFTVSAFQLTQENVLTLDTNNTLFQTQTGEVQFRGIEFESKISLTEGFSVVGGVTMLDSEITENNDGNEGNDVAAAPDHMASLWLDYTFSSGFFDGLGIGAGARYVGARYGDNANNFRIPSYTLFDAAIRYDLGKLNSSLGGTKISLNVTNLEDQTYVAKAETNLSANYGPGRVVSVNLSYEW